MRRAVVQGMALAVALGAGAPVFAQGQMINSTADLAGHTLLLTETGPHRRTQWLAFDPSGLFVATMATLGADKPFWDGKIMHGQMVTGFWFRAEGNSISWNEDAFVDSGVLDRGADGRYSFTVTRGIDGKALRYPATVLPGLVAPGSKPPRRGKAKVTINDKTATGQWIRWDGFAYGVNNPAMQPGKATILPDPQAPGKTCVWMHDPEVRKMALHCPSRGFTTATVGERPRIPEPPAGTRTTWTDTSGNTVSIDLD
jgi:hypothetical protein